MTKKPSDVRVVRTYIDGGFRVCVLVKTTETQYHLIPFTIGLMKVKRVKKHDYRLSNVDS